MISRCHRSQANAAGKAQIRNDDIDDEKKDMRMLAICMNAVTMVDGARRGMRRAKEKERKKH